jgi:hypothetical protein
VLLPQIPYNGSYLLSLIKVRTVYWKEIARRNFFKAYPQADPSEFEWRWPTVLTNFFLAETVHVAISLREVSENRMN